MRHKGLIRLLPSVAFLLLTLFFYLQCLQLFRSSGFLSPIRDVPSDEGKRQEHQLLWSKNDEPHRKKKIKQPSKNEQNQPATPTISRPRQQDGEAGPQTKDTVTLMNGTTVVIPSYVTAFYSPQRVDRIGSSIMSYLLAHAFSFKLGRTFLGACGAELAKPLFRSRIRAQKDMLAMLNLQEEIPVTTKCPNRKNKTSMFLTEGLFTRLPLGSLFTQEWLQRMKSLQPLTVTTKTSRQKDRVLVAHVRRGDVSPCDSYTASRYLPNSYYLSLIKHYQTDMHRVVVYSELDSWEDWTDFKMIPQLELKLNDSEIEVWRGIMQADLFISSRSTFSAVPALLAKGKVICSQDCLPQWEKAPADLLKNAIANMKKLKADHC